MSKQRYNEQQIGAILQRSGEIQAGLSPEGDAQGLTLEELQKVALEVGIEPHVVEQAALEVGTGAMGAKSDSAGKVLDHTVVGEITDEQWEDIVIRLRQYAGKAGTSTLQGSTREWTGEWDTGSLTLTASSRNGQTRLRLVGDASSAGAVGWVLGLIGGFLSVLIGGALVGKAGLGALAVIGTILFLGTLCFFLTRALANSWTRSIQKNLSQLFSDVVSKASSAAPRIAATRVSVEAVGGEETVEQGA